jgi:Uma2 family endonuclease
MLSGKDGDMTTASRRAEQLMTVAEFLLWRAEVTDDARYELVHGLPVQLMAPTNLRHAQIQYNTGQALRQAIAAEGLPCRVYDAGPGVAVGIEGDECRIPDVVATCAGELDESSSLVPEPVIVVEVASRSTRLADVIDKVEFYSRIESIRHYLVIEQDQRRVVYHSRGLTGVLEPHILRQGSIFLDPPGIALALASLYLDTALADPEQPPAGSAG